MVLFALTALVHSAPLKWLNEPLQRGDVQQAARLAYACIDEAGDADGGSPAADAASICEIALLCGDLMLAQDRDEEAEDCYRRAMKTAAHGPRGSVRVLSCRTTGFMNLYQQRYGTAVACLRRVIDDAAAAPMYRIEALCGLALAHHSMGQQEQAMGFADRAVELAGDHASDAYTPGLVMLASVLRTELRVRQDIRAHGELHDHVFWKLPAHGARRLQDPAQPPMHPLTAVEACLSAYGAQTLVANHLRHLRNLIRVTCGDANALQQLVEHLSWLRQSHLSAPERQARLETALVAIVARSVDVARSVLDPLCGRHAESKPHRWSLELSYCLARVCALSGHSDESLKHYQRYALESVQCLRAETVDAGPVDAHARQTSSAAVKDDVEMALPAKYRRAYRYMLEHLDCADLSVREIAEEIGVTERALQSAFRTQLGMTPAEVLRRCRVERIRQDLLRGDMAGATVIETASRWGIRNRSTLVSVYRKYFHETPAQTLQQREGTVAAAVCA
jgi:AraC-like DNA-binding protein/tetratricopeptide (TPR) repeat protein